MPLGTKPQLWGHSHGTSPLPAAADERCFTDVSGVLTPFSQAAQAHANSLIPVAPRPAAAASHPDAGPGGSRCASGGLPVHLALPTGLLLKLGLQRPHPSCPNPAFPLTWAQGIWNLTL